MTMRPEDKIAEIQADHKKVNADVQAVLKDIKETKVTDDYTMTIDFEKDPDYIALLEEVREDFSIMTPDERKAHLTRMEETMPSTFEDDSLGMAMAQKILQYAKDLDAELTAKIHGGV